MFESGEKLRRWITRRVEVLRERQALRHQAEGRTEVLNAQVRGLMLEAEAAAAREVKCMHVHLIVSRDSRTNGLLKHDWLRAFTGVDFRGEGPVQSAQSLHVTEVARRIRWDFWHLGDREHRRFPRGRYGGRAESRLGRALGTCEVEVADGEEGCPECRARGTYEVDLGALWDAKDPRRRQGGGTQLGPEGD